MRRWAEFTVRPHGADLLLPVSRMLLKSPKPFEIGCSLKSHGDAHKHNSLANK